MLEDELEASLSLAELEETDSQNHSLEGNSFETDSFQSNAFEQAQATADDLNIEQQLAAEASAESEYLNEFAELEALDMPDLETGDDNSVAKFEPPSSVERPSQLLDSYPELEMTEDGDLIFDEDDALNEPMVDVDELLLDLDQPLDLASLKELDDTNFDELLSELAEVELPDDDLAANEPFDVDLSLEDELLNSADADNSGLSAEVPALPDFVNIDRLLAATDEDQASVDPASRLNIDVGLADFDDLILPEEAGDVDATDNGFAGKMDLVRAYIEIGDGESANQLIKDIMASDAPAHVKQEALSLKS
jgi:FimV-like protein